MKKSKLLIIIGGLILYLIAAGASYATFHFLGGSSAGLISPVEIPQAGDGFKIDPNAPKTEKCPLNGGMFSKAERQIWEKRRPLTVMIENHTEARPQSGLSKADVVYETVAEGGITRFLYAPPELTLWILLLNTVIILYMLMSVEQMFQARPMLWVKSVIMAGWLKGMI
ncbi:MAG: DUF3048 domain-containing protein [Candidatus Shapirobacteria bacterium]|nr:DUF3048 domain-containing protein [Candidatus Shapirobacteria bacterium]